MLRHIAGFPSANGIHEEYVRMAVSIGFDELRLIVYFLRDDRFNFGPLAATNGLDAALMPGDMLRASGTALKGGRAYIIVER